MTKEHAKARYKAATELAVHTCNAYPSIKCGACEAIGQARLQLWKDLSDAIDPSGATDPILDALLAK